jgi:hypothetical protein
MEKQVETSREVRIINDMEFERVPGHIGQMWDRVVSLWIEFKSKNTNPDIYFIALDKEGRGYNYYIDGRDYDLLEIYGFGSNGLPIEVYKNAISISDTSRRLVIEYKNEKKYDQESLSYTWKWIVVIHPRLESK